MNSMFVADKLKALLERESFRPLSLPLMNRLARLQGHGVERIFLDDGIWMHATSRGYFAYHQPYLRLDLTHLDEVARNYFFWGYRPQAGDTILDVGAGVGEETLTFSRAVGERGRVICIEARPRTFRCLEKMVQYNRLHNVVPTCIAAAEPGCSSLTLEDSDDYLANRCNAAAGVSVPAVTIDAILEQLGLGRVHFLKMNIEGAERLAIQGMIQTVRQTEVLCISCHDFLAQTTGDDSLRTKNTIRDFMRERGLRVIERSDPDLPPFVRDQLWTYNDALLRRAAS